MTRKRTNLLVRTTVVVASGLLWSIPVAGQGWPDFDSPPSGRANQGVMVNGEFVGTDEIHFARGANADGLDHEQYYAPGGVPPEPAPTPVESDDVYRQQTWGAFGTDRSAHNGDYLLPTDTDQWPDFTADLVFTRLAADASNVYVHLRFASFPRPESQIATLTFTSESASPALTDWPRNAGVGSEFSHVITLWATDAAVQQAGGAEAMLSTLGGETRVTDHAFEARIPLASLPAGPWRVGIGSGLADPANPSQYWTVPAGEPSATTPGTDNPNATGSNVWDLMFTPRDPQWFDDHVQADLLTAGDVSAAVIRVDPAQLQAGASMPASAITGRVAHTYESAFDFGDGIARGSMSTPPMPAELPPQIRTRDAAVNYEYTGSTQPYFAYIPEAYPSSTHNWPLVLYFHGLNNYIWEPFGLTLGLEDQLEQRGYLFASLLGRGDISYTGPGEIDVLEALAHLRARYRIDPQRIYIMGHSHGAGGQLEFTRRNPDMIGAIAPAQILETAAQSENFLHVPSIHIAGAQDPIDNGNGARSRYDALSALGYDAQFLLYASKTHENSSIYDTLPRIFDQYDRTAIPQNPGRIVFTRAGGDFDETLGLLHDRAYWVSGLNAVDPASDMIVRAESFAIPHNSFDPALAARSGDQIIDAGGPSGRTAATFAQTMPDAGQPLPVSNTASLQLRNANGVTLDIGRMALDLAMLDARIDVDLDAPTMLKLEGVPGVLGDQLSWRALNADGAELDSGTATRANEAFSIAVPQSATALLFMGSQATLDRATSTGGGALSVIGLAWLLLLRWPPKRQDRRIA